MRYNFKRLSGREWYDTIKRTRGYGLTFLEVSAEELYQKDKVNQVFNAYYYRTTSSCKLIYYEWEGDRYRKRLREISFSPREIDTLRCVLTFRKIASGFGELIPYEPETRPYTNGVYTYYRHTYSGLITVLDMRSAYLYALQQPLAVWDTRTEVTVKQVWDKEYDYYCFENDLHREMFYKEDTDRMSGAMLWAGLKIYGYKAKRHYQKTCAKLYELKVHDQTDFYKNVANIAVGCMHKRSGKQNNATLASSLYAWFQWHIDNLVAKFEKKGYDVVMVTTDSIKIKGLYTESDNIIPIGTGLGEFKYEYVGEAKYYSQGRYEEARVKWKGKPTYLIDGHKRCKFVENIEEELKVYEQYAKV